MTIAAIALMLLSGIFLTVVRVRNRRADLIESRKISLSRRDKQIAAAALAFFLLGFALLLVSIARNPRAINTR